MVQAVLWDFGGVITTSPFERFAVYEKERGLPAEIIRRINATNPDTNAWALLERSEINTEQFDEMFATEAASLGHQIRGADVLSLVGGELRPEMVTALKRCRERLKIGCITNDMRATPQRLTLNVAQGQARRAAITEVHKLFHVIIRSSEVGLRKPDPRIYLMACDALGVQPDQCVFLDDIGSNLKPARSLGMQTIKVMDPAVAIAELEKAVGFRLG